MSQPGELTRAESNAARERQATRQALPRENTDDARFIDAMRRVGCRIEITGQGWVAVSPHLRRN